MEMNYCRRCGTALRHTGGHAYICTNNHSIYAGSTPTVGIFFVTSDKHVLMSVRGIEPHKGMLDSFGGFLDGEETFENAAIRELQEELNLKPHDYGELRYLCSGVGHYPYENETLPVISCFFWTELKTKSTLVGFDDVAVVSEVALDSIDMTLLHDDDIRVGIRKLQDIFSL